jgi:hypothetical protein
LPGFVIGDFAAIAARMILVLAIEKVANFMERR